MTNLPTEESAPDEIELIKKKMEDFLNQKKECQKRVRKLMAAEDPSQGIFHNQEIFALQQDSLRLEVEAEFCRKKINRLSLGYES
ncbi:MAG: hypothetical protein D5R98_03590 [Desulfonatronovibrio sp. MSAO_Bac4]|nr:MAG: hypothetical protein D5R98_03590 [Desulfonatronovibrio sp. MSAO_Bac4]